jgi:Ca2+-binding EF-hand superfamily protein
MVEAACPCKRTALNSLGSKAPRCFIRSMLLAPLLMSAAVAAQAPQPATSAQPQPSAFESRTRSPGRLFISPMGEPFVGRTAGEDGLVVWFQRADRNHDGMITVDEMSADADRFFEALDRTHDGEIDPDDINYYEEVVPEIRAVSIITASTSPGGDVTEHVDNETHAGRFGLLQIPEPVSSADSNFNRGVSPQEFRDAAVARFQLLDTSHMGKLTLPELQDIRQAAAAYVKRKRDIKPGESYDPHSAEYGSH